MLAYNPPLGREMRPLEIRMSSIPPASQIPSSITLAPTKAVESYRPDAAPASDGDSDDNKTSSAAPAGVGEHVDVRA